MTPEAQFSLIRSLRADPTCTIGRGDGPCPACNHVHARLEPRPPCDACGATDETLLIVTPNGGRYCRRCRREGGPRWSREP